MHTNIKTEHQEYYNALRSNQMNSFKILIAQWAKIEKMAANLNLHLAETNRKGSTNSKRNKILNLNNINVDDITKRLEGFADQLQTEITKQQRLYLTTLRELNANTPEEVKKNTVEQCNAKLTELIKLGNKFDEIKSLIALSEKELLMTMGVRSVSLPECELPKREAAYASEQRIAALVRPKDKKENNNNNNNVNDNNAVVSSNAPPPPPLPPADYFKAKEYSIKRGGHSLNNNNNAGSLSFLDELAKFNRDKLRSVSANHSNSQNGHLNELNDAVKNKPSSEMSQFAHLEGKKPSFEANSNVIDFRQNLKKTEVPQIEAFENLNDNLPKGPGM